MNDDTSRPGDPDPEQGQIKVTMDPRRIHTTYSNVCNVSCTREEVTLLLGVNKTWQGIQQDVEVEITDRVILNPHAAKRLAQVLNSAVEAYENQFGALANDGRAR